MTFKTITFDQEALDGLEILSDAAINCLDVSDTDNFSMSFCAKDVYEKQILCWAFEFTQKLLDKYRKGKAEHGQLDANAKIFCEKEVAEEIKDIICYFCIDKAGK